MNLCSLLGDSLELHTRPRKLARTKTLPIPCVHHVENVFSYGQLLPPKQDGKLLVGVHNFRPLQKGNAFHGMSSQCSEPLLAFTDNLLIHHPLANVSDLQKHLAVSCWNSFPLSFEHGPCVASNQAAHFGRPTLEYPFIFRFKQPFLITLKHPESVSHIPNSVHPSLRRRPIKHATSHGIPSHRRAF